MIIGISGKKRSGKDTVADILCATYPKCIKYYFAAPLKQEVARACNVSVEFIENNKAMFRPILQWWGTDWRRNHFDTAYWTKKVDTAITHFTSFNHIILPDVRFPNELEFVKMRGGITIRVEKLGLPADGHESETALDDYSFDYAVQNNGTIDDLIRQVSAIKL